MLPRRERRISTYGDRVLRDETDMERVIGQIKENDRYTFLRWLIVVELH